MLIKKRVYRLMKEAGISGKHPRRKHGNYEKVSKELITDNLLMQNFTASNRNEIWFGDITYIPTKEGFLYLMAFMDVYSRKIVGWSMAKHMREQLALDALESAILGESPKSGLVIHTGRGSQFIGKRFQSELKKNGITASMSRSGNPYDNAIMESFNKSLKTELLYENKTFTSRNEAKKAIFELK
ncbi:IS3 family transposase [Wukongibacter sp. M2B1]|uniref:IS3 family transposase n=1 Tax=Wukongibacter sp. M2B1 TaxID=3088895 RepID=UPI003D7AF7AC